MWPPVAEVLQRAPGFLAQGGDPLWGGLGSSEKELRAAESSGVAQLCDAKTVPRSEKWEWL